MDFAFYNRFVGWHWHWAAFLMKLLARFICLFIPVSAWRKNVRRVMKNISKTHPTLWRYVIPSEKNQNRFIDEFKGKFIDKGHDRTVSNWKSILTNNPKSIIEIGSWHGWSAAGFNALFPIAHITCVDNWQGSDALDMSVNPEDLFDKNTAPFADKITKIKSDSALALAKLGNENRKFDIAFVDASHFEPDVMVDTILAWRLLDVGGILIWDDYVWEFKPFGKHTATPAINHFIKRYRNQLKILSVTRQVIVQRTALNPFDLK